MIQMKCKSCRHFLVLHGSEISIVWPSSRSLYWSVLLSSAIKVEIFIKWSWQQKKSSLQVKKMQYFQIIFWENDDIQILLHIFFFLKKKNTHTKNFVLFYPNFTSYIAMSFPQACKPRWSGFALPHNYIITSFFLKSLT